MESTNYNSCRTEFMYKRCDIVKRQYAGRCFYSYLKSVRKLYHMFVY